MKKRLYQDDFEAFLSESADAHRMYPSDKVWRKIDRELHGDKHWPALTFTAILTGALILAGLVLLKPEKDLFEAKARQNTSSVARVENKVSAAFPDAVAAVESRKQVKQELQNQQTVSADLSQPQEDITSLDAEKNSNPAQLENNLQSAAGAYAGELPDETTTGNSLIERTLLVQDNHLNIAQEQIAPPDLAQTTTNMPDAADKANSSEMVSATAAAFSGNAGTSITLNKLPASRWSMQYYVTPSMSYRLLYEDKELDVHNYTNGLMPATYYNNVNAMVNQKAKLGFEAGAGVLYRVNNKFSVKGGLQVNYRQFGIDAYETSGFQPAILRLNRGVYYDSIRTVARISNYPNSNKSTELTNKYLQLSMPVGFELNISESRNTAFVLSSTIQPTYLISQEVWLISSDYGSYVQRPDLLNRWNLNTSVEAFLRISGKNMNWQLGPQIRYQMMPSANSKYTVHEHLIDYGFKIGISKAMH